MDIRIGVYICECGPNIKDAMHLEEVTAFAKSLEHVVFVRQFRLLCSNEGKEIIARDIKEQSLNRIVIAACSPKEHELTFRKVLSEAGLNPYLLQIANIREHIAWMITDKELATQLAKVKIRAAVKRVVYQEPLDVKEIEASPDVVVIGAGIAGISAALTLAQKQRKVYLIECLPCIGGKAVRYEDVFPNLECAPCMLEPKMDEVLHNDNIEVLTLTEVKEVLGFFGNFIVKVNQKARFVDSSLCISCRACIEACPVKVKNEFDENLGERKAIYFPFPGALPSVPVIDRENCLRFQGKECNACQTVCAFGAIKYEDKDTERELNVGAIVVATGFDLFNPKLAAQFGYGKIDNVYTSLEFERILSATGPYGGKILLKDGSSPKKIALIHCVGSRSKRYRPYCSAICCSYLIKFAHIIKHKLPEASIVSIYSDLCLPDKEAQSFFDKLKKEEGIEFIRVRDTNETRVSLEEGRICILNTTVEDEYKSESHSIITGKLIKVVADMVVLAGAIEGARDAGHLAELLDLPLDEARFFKEEHCKLSPASTTNDGIFIAGCANAPRDITNSVIHAEAAAGGVLKRLVPGEKISLEPTIAEVNKDLCSGCKTCIEVCPYRAISYDEEEKRAVVSEMLCRGCGVCVATCPSGTIKAKHFTDKQISSEIEGLLEK